MSQDRVNHLGIIADGERRWARQHGVSFYVSYWDAMRKLVELMDAAFDFGVNIQSAYLLSRENLKRSRDNLDPALEAEERLVRELLPEFCKHWNCEVGVAGLMDLLPQSYAAALSELIIETKHAISSPQRKFYILAPYNPWDELQYAISQAPDPKDINDYMWVKEPLDLVIRTGNAPMISNFLPLQSAYAEFFFTSKLFNDLDVSDVVSALKAFPVGGPRLKGS